MTDLELISDSLAKLIKNIESQNYKGYDPYDALKSPLFRLPLLRSNKLIRFGAQQFVKRFPLNLRPLLGIPKGYNPVTLGLCIQGYAYLIKATQLPFTDYRISITACECLEKINYLIRELKKLITPGYHGSCWGYDFPWEARYTSIPAYGPTVVATGIVTNALFIAYKITESKECAELVKSAAEFVLYDLNITALDDSHVYSYSPFDHQQVFNASMKGVRILSQAYSLTGDLHFKEEAKKAVKFIVSNQRSDGSWGYSLASQGGWTDNYHTGYILDCLHDYTILTKDSEFKLALELGYSFYKSQFISESGMPNIFAGQTYPADCTSGAQTILTSLRFGDKAQAKKVALWIISNMMKKSGRFYYRKNKTYSIKTSFIRWSDSWMFASLAYLLNEMK